GEIAATFTGQVPDRELVCVKGYQLPIRGEPCSQGDVRGKVVDVTGVVENFTVRISMLSVGRFQPGELRFGGMNMAIIEAEREYHWHVSSDIKQARKDIPQLGGFINTMVKAASVNPKLVDVVTDPETEWPISKVDQMDKMFIFSKVMPREVRPAG